MRLTTGQQADLKSKVEADHQDLLNHPNIYQAIADALNQPTSQDNPVTQAPTIPRPLPTPVELIEYATEDELFLIEEIDNFREWFLERKATFSEAGIKTGAAIRLQYPNAWQASIFNIIDLGLQDVAIPLVYKGENIIWHAYPVNLLSGISNLLVEAGLLSDDERDPNNPSVIVQEGTAGRIARRLQEEYPDPNWSPTIPHMSYAQANYGLVLTAEDVQDALNAITP